MALLERLRSSIFGEREGPAVYRCRACGGYFSKPRDLARSEIDCPFCGSAGVSAHR